MTFPLSHPRQDEHPTFEDMKAEGLMPMRMLRHGSGPIYDVDLVAQDASLVAKRQSRFMSAAAGRKARKQTKESIEKDIKAVSDLKRETVKPSERWADELRVYAVKASGVATAYKGLVEKETNTETREGLRQRHLFGLAQSTKYSDLSVLSEKGLDGLCDKENYPNALSSREEALTRVKKIDGESAICLYARDNGRNPIEEGGLPSHKEFEQMASGGKEQAKALNAMRSWIVEDKRDLDGPKGKGAYVARRNALEEIKKDPFGEKARSLDKQILALDVGKDNPVKKLLESSFETYSAIKERSVAQDVR